MTPEGEKDKTGLVRNLRTLECYTLCYTECYTVRSNTLFYVSYTQMLMWNVLQTSPPSCS